MLKEKIKEYLENYVKITLAFIVIAFIIRIYEYILLSGGINLPDGSLLYELRGFGYDTILLLCAGYIFLIPYLLISLLNKKAAYFIYIFLFLIYGISVLLLLKYFSITAVPLDEVFFTYNIKEILEITDNSVTLNISDYIPYIIFITITIVTVFYFLRLRLNKLLYAGFYLLLILSVFLTDTVKPKKNRYSKDINYNLAINKLAYFVNRYQIYYNNIKKETGTFPDLKKTVKQYQKDELFEYVDYHYPLLHKNNSENILGNYFDLKEEKPDIVLIIVESLSASFCGKNPYFGSFTPNLDSLINHSLYFPNIISSGERTLNVLQAVLASLPPSKDKDGFTNEIHKIPLHHSLISILRTAGYHTSFFYAGNIKFNYMGDFIRKQKTDYILNYFGKAYQKDKENNTILGWGYNDGVLFSRSLEVIDSLQKHPSLSVYLTLSMHSPFDIPNKEHYNKKFEKRLNELKLSSNKRKDRNKNKKIFLSVLYTDEELKRYINEYKKRKTFANTIFIITGDHSMPELGLWQISELERYHVPLIIYSPLIKKTAVFNSISSHYDITPSLLTMLKSKYGISSGEMSHWLGTGLDSSRSFRCTKRQTFILNNRRIEDYIDNNYYISNERLYKVLNNARLKQIQNESLYNVVNDRFQIYNKITAYVSSSKKLLPDKFFFGKELTPEFIEAMEKCKLSKNDIPETFTSVLKKMKLKKIYKRIKLNVSFKYYTNEKNLNKAPELVFEYIDNEGNREIWEGYNISDFVKTPGQVEVCRTIDLSFIKNAGYIKMYLWNKNDCKIKYDNLKLTLLGYL